MSSDTGGPDSTDELSLLVEPGKQRARGRIIDLVVAFVIFAVPAMLLVALMIGPAVRS